MPGEKAAPANANPDLSPRTVRRRDDGARFIARFEALTGMRVQSASIEGLPREFLSRAVPAPNLLIERYGYELEPRTHNALCRYEPGRQPEAWTFGRLLEIRGFGVFSLIDLLEVLRRHTTRTLE